jgi:hypothetical protein
MLPNKDNDIEEDKDVEDYYSQQKRGGDWEMASRPPMSPRFGSAGSGQLSPSPFTPRTQAFNTLDRKLPFRQYQ